MDKNLSAIVAALLLGAGGLATSACGDSGGSGGEGGNGGMAGCGGGRLASVDYGGVLVRVKSIFTLQVGSATSALLLSRSHGRSA